MTTSKPLRRGARIDGLLKRLGADAGGFGNEGVRGRGGFSCPRGRSAVPGYRDAAQGSLACCGRRATVRRNRPSGLLIDRSEGERHGGLDCNPDHTRGPIEIGYRLQSQSAFPLRWRLAEGRSIGVAHCRGRRAANGATDMPQSLKGHIGRTLAVAGIVAGVAAITSSAFAGECPAGAMKPNAREPVTFQPLGVTDTTLGSVDLGKEMLAAKDHTLRFRKLTIAPGGIVPWHSHDDRPALIYVAEGEIIEYAEQLFAADRSQGRRSPSRDTRHVTLVEEPRRQDRCSLRRRRAARQERPQHVIRLRGASPGSAFDDAALPLRAKAPHRASSESSANVQELDMSQTSLSTAGEVAMHMNAEVEIGAPFLRPVRAFAGNWADGFSHGRRPVCHPGDPAVARPTL